ncbi:MAG: ribosomal RNA small subunit methyltransferase D [Lysobacteraceae bacterium]|nr:MAG: ribosomal RNA small subunit methyltransferase D [Xanthomonadaceae bacterium]
MGGDFLKMRNIGKDRIGGDEMVAPGRPPQGRARKAPGSVRIIAGRFRGSRLPVPDLPGLRPTSDRVRETLFNWLQHDLPEARVLDLFAGSGALGFEAASRGASRVLMVERAPELAAALRASAERLQARSVEVRCADALDPATLGAGECFDGAFIDPPFAAGLWQPAIARILPHLAPRAWLYLESARGVEPVLPAEWSLHREGRTREVRHALYRRGA